MDPPDVQAMPKSCPMIGRRSYSPELVAARLFHHPAAKYGGSAAGATMLRRKPVSRLERGLSKRGVQPCVPQQQIVFE
jgi:hypothetical protein